jgi:hypothetical protein
MQLHEAAARCRLPRRRDRLVGVEQARRRPDPPERGVWSDLPNPPEAGPFEFGVGVLTRKRGHYFSPHGWVLDTTRDRWSEIPRLEPNRTHIGGRTVTSAGRSLLVFGGAKFDRNTPDGRLLNATWIWSPPAPGD